MKHKQSIQRYRYLYAKLLRFFSKSFYDRYGEGMQQTFNDILRERTNVDKGLFVCAVWMFLETSGNIFKNYLKSILMKNKRMTVIAVATVVLLMVPLVAMQFTTEVNWTVMDFVIAGIILLGTGLAYELVTRKSGNTVYKIAAAIAVGTGLLLIWSNLAVGLIKSDNTIVNLFYLGVLAVAFIGTFIVRLKPQGMVWVLIATAFAQVLVPVIAMSIWKSQITSSPEQMIGVTVFFAVLWVASALLFRVSTHNYIEIKIKSTG